MKPNRYFTEISLPVRGEYSEITILDLKLNVSFTCLSSCGGHERQTDSLFCIKPGLNNNMSANMLLCTIMRIEILNISQNILNINSSNFIAFDKDGYQHHGQELCECFNNNYFWLKNGYSLYPEGKVRFTLCFSGLGAEEKMSRLVYNCREQGISPIGIGKLLTTVEIFDLTLTE